MSVSCEIADMWMQQDSTDDESTLVQVMACRQATSHYLDVCWPSSVLPYGVTRVNELTAFSNILREMAASQSDVMLEIGC